MQHSLFPHTRRLPPGSAMGEVELSFQAVLKTTAENHDQGGGFAAAPGICTSRAWDCDVGLGGGVFDSTT